MEYILSSVSFTQGIHVGFIDRVLANAALVDCRMYVGPIQEQSGFEYCMTGSH